MTKQDRQKFKHTRVSDKVLEDLTLKAADKSVYAALSYFSNNKTSECFPSRETLWKFAGISDKTLRNSIKTLADSGYIEVEARKTHGRQATNLYRLL